MGLLGNGAAHQILKYWRLYTDPSMVITRTGSMKKAASESTVNFRGRTGEAENCRGVAGHWPLRKRLITAPRAVRQATLISKASKVQPAFISPKCGRRARTTGPETASRVMEVKITPITNGPNSL